MENPHKHIICTLKEMKAGEGWIDPVLEITINIRNLYSNNIKMIDGGGYLGIKINDRPIGIGKFQSPSRGYVKIQSKDDEDIAFLMDLTYTALEKITKEITASKQKKLVMDGRMYIRYQAYEGSRFSDPAFATLNINSFKNSNIELNLIEWLEIIEKLNFNTYSVFVIRKTDSIDTLPENLKERVKNIDNRLNDILTDFMKGEYENVLIKSRKILNDIQNIFDDQKIRDAIDRGIIPEKGYKRKKDRIKEMISKTHYFCGITAHSGEEPEGSRIPWPVNREDAQLILYSTFSFVDLLTKYIEKAYE